LMRFEQEKHGNFGFHSWNMGQSANMEVPKLPSVRNWRLRTWCIGQQFSGFRFEAPKYRIWLCLKIGATHKQPNRNNEDNPWEFRTFSINFQTKPYVSLMFNGYCGTRVRLISHMGTSEMVKHGETQNGPLLVCNMHSHPKIE
jgi:hypothetical protein